MYIMSEDNKNSEEKICIGRATAAAPAATPGTAKGTAKPTPAAGGTAAPAATPTPPGGARPGFPALASTADIVAFLERVVTILGKRWAVTCLNLVSF